jgi:CheY-like chemotaxis protein
VRLVQEVPAAISLFLVEDATQVPLPSMLNANERYLILADKPHAIESLWPVSQVQVTRLPVTPLRLISALSALLGLEVKHTGLMTSGGSGFADRQTSIEGFDHLRVLVAEDNPVNQKVIMAYLKRLGIEAKLAANGREAIDVFLSTPSCRPFDLVIMDCEMPLVDGWAAARTIRDCASSQKAHRPLVIIALSAHAMNIERVRAAQSGMDDYLAKPLRLNDLIKMLDKQGLRRSDSRQSNVRILHHPRK